MKKTEIKKTILERYIMLLSNNAYDFRHIIGLGLSKFNYENIYENMLTFTTDDHDCLSQNEKEEFTTYFINIISWVGWKLYFNNF